MEEDLPKEGVEQHKATESSKEESESNRKEQQLGESAESEGSEKVSCRTILFFQ